MPQTGHFPAWCEVWSGCIGQNHAVPAGVTFEACNAGGAEDEAEDEAASATGAAEISGVVWAHR